MTHVLILDYAFLFPAISTVEEAVYVASAAADVVNEISGFMNFTKRKQRR